MELIRNYLNGRYQRVVLDGRSSSWKPNNNRSTQGSVLGHLFFLIYIDDLCDDLSCDVKLFADDTSGFQCEYFSTKIKQRFEKDTGMGFLWKMQFNPDPLKQAVQVIFSAKKVKPNHPQYILMGKKLSLKPSKNTRFYSEQTIKF